MCLHLFDYLGQLHNANCYLNQKLDYKMPFEYHWRKCEGEVEEQGSRADQAVILNILSEFFHSFPMNV